MKLEKVNKQYAKLPPKQQAILAFEAISREDESENEVTDIR
jgi:hypothetical protein